MPKIGYKKPQSVKDKIALSHKGKKHSLVHREKIKYSLLGNKRCLGYKHTEEAKKNMSNARIGHISGMVGKKHSVETRAKMSVANLGEKAPGWKGGITKKNAIIRSSFQYRLWREAVFTRDNYTCVWCGKRGVTLNADHIKPFAYFPELRFAIDNGRTLCVPCHRTTDTYALKCRQL